MKTQITKTLFIAAFLIFGITYSQVNKTAPSTKIFYQSSQNIHDEWSRTNNDPGSDKISEKLNKLYEQLREARETNNAAEKEKIEKQIQSLTGGQNVPLNEDRRFVCEFMGNVPVEGGDYQTSVIANGGHFSAATQTQPSNFSNPGRIWTACTKYVFQASDTLNIYYSTNSGVNWVSAYRISGSTSTFDFMPGELDIELVWDGTTTWLFGVAGYYDNGSNCMFFRINTTTNAVAAFILTWPGIGGANRYYNPRITSDNSVFTNNAYVMLSCSFDSTYNSTLHYGAMKFAKLTTPFAGVSPAVDYSMPAGNRFNWFASGLPAVNYLWSDIAYTKASGNSDRIITVCNFQGSSVNNMYVAWSDNYGSTIGSAPVFSETNLTYGARIAFNGGNNNPNGMIVYNRLYLAPDWDPYCISTTNAGLNWNGSFVDNRTTRSRSVDVIALRGANNLFKIAYTQDSAGGTYGYYTGGTPGSFNQPNTAPISLTGVDTSNTKAIAGYILGGGDDCLAIYSYHPGSGIYAARLCQTPVGISGNNNNIPGEFVLFQNYPNPFNPATNIKFSIPKSSVVKLVVYDASGKEIETLVNSNLDAGNYSYDFNGEGLASGVYFYKLETEGFSEVKKMVLIK